MGNLWLFNFHFPNIWRVFMFMISGTRGNAHAPGNHYSWLGIHQVTEINPRKNPNHFRGRLFSKSGIAKNQKCWKRRVRIILEIFLISSWRSWTRDQHLSKKHEMDILDFPIQLCERMPPSIPPSHPPTFRWINCISSKLFAFSALDRWYL